MTYKQNIELTDKKRKVSQMMILLNASNFVLEPAFMPMCDFLKEQYGLNTFEAVNEVKVLVRIIETVKTIKHI